MEKDLKGLISKTDYLIYMLLGLSAAWFIVSNYHRKDWAHLLPLHLTYFSLLKTAPTQKLKDCSSNNNVRQHKYAQIKINMQIT